jgi:hypothetical protein
MLFEPVGLIALLLVAAFWIFILYLVLRSFQALKGIEKSIAEIAEVLKTKR